MLLVCYTPSLLKLCCLFINLFIVVLFGAWQQRWKLQVKINWLLWIILNSWTTQSRYTRINIYYKYIYIKKFCSLCSFSLWYDAFICSYLHSSFNMISLTGLMRENKPCHHSYLLIYYKDNKNEVFLLGGIYRKKKKTCLKVVQWIHF